MEVILERFNFENVENLIEALGARARPPLVHQMWSEILGDLLSAQRRLFDTERGWPDNKPQTTERKARDNDTRVRMNAHKTNVATGALRAFMTSRGAGKQPLKMDADELRIGIPAGASPVFYGRIQAEHGRDPLVSRAVVRRIASSSIRRHLLGGL